MRADIWKLDSSAPFQPYACLLQYYSTSNDPLKALEPTLSQYCKAVLSHSQMSEESERKRKAKRIERRDSGHQLKKLAKLKATPASLMLAFVNTGRCQASNEKPCLALLMPH